MNVSCPECGTTYRVNPRKIPSNGVIARCARCPREFPISAVTTDEQLRDRAISPDSVDRMSDPESRRLTEKGWRAGDMHGDAHTDAPVAIERGSPSSGGSTSESSVQASQPPSADWGDRVEAGAGTRNSDVEGEAPAEDTVEPALPTPEHDTWDESLGYVREEIVSDVSPFDTRSGSSSARWAFTDTPAETDAPAETEDLAAAPSGGNAIWDEDRAELQSDLTPEESPRDGVGAGGASPPAPEEGGVDRAARSEKELPGSDEALESTLSGGGSDLPPPPFGFTDPHSRARRLARALVSDIVVYHPDRRERSLREGTLRQEFREEIRKSWDEYASHVGEKIARETTYFRDALNELLAGGTRLF